MNGRKEALEYCNTGNLRRDLRNHGVSDRAIDYIIDSVELYGGLSKMITKIRKIVN